MKPEIYTYHKLSPRLQNKVALEYDSVTDHLTGKPEATVLQLSNGDITVQARTQPHPNQTQQVVA